VSRPKKRSFACPKGKRRCIYCTRAETVIFKRKRAEAESTKIEVVPVTEEWQLDEQSSLSDYSGRDTSKDTPYVWYCPERGYIFRDTEEPKR
jgi:hypothetical protein